MTIEKACDAKHDDDCEGNNPSWRVDFIFEVCKVLHRLALEFLQRQLLDEIDHRYPLDGLHFLKRVAKLDPEDFLVSPAHHTNPIDIGILCSTKDDYDVVLFGAQPGLTKGILVRRIISVHKQRDDVGLLLRTQLLQDRRQVIGPLLQIGNIHANSQRSIDPVIVVDFLWVGRNHALELLRNQLVREVEHAFRHSLHVVRMDVGVCIRLADLGCGPTRRGRSTLAIDARDTRMADVGIYDPVDVERMFVAGVADGRRRTRAMPFAISRARLNLAAVTRVAMLARNLFVVLASNLAVQDFNVHGLTCFAHVEGKERQDQKPSSTEADDLPLDIRAKLL